MSTVAPARRAPVAPPAGQPDAPAGSERRTTIATLVWSASLPAAGSLSVALAWGGWRMPLIMLAATVLPFVLLTVITRLGVSRWATASVLATLLVLLAYVLGAGAGTTLLGTVRDAIPLLLSEPQPLPLRADLVVAPLLLAGLVSLLVALRSLRPARVAPLLGALVLYGAGALLTGGRGDRIGLVAALVVVLAVIGWVVLDETNDSRRTRLTLIGPVLVVAVGFIASSALVPADRPFDPRSRIDPPIVQTEVSSPLPQLAAWAANPDVELFTTSGDVAPMRLVVLDEYDGQAWRAATRYGPLGAEGGDRLPDGRDRARFTTAVRVADLGGAWLPVPGDPTGLSGTEALVDPRTGTLLAPEGAADAEYEVTAVVDAPLPSDLPAAGLAEDGPGVPVEQFLALPDMPYELAVYAGQVVAGTTTPYQRAVAIERAVRGQREVSESALSGSALWRIEDFLLGDPATVAGAQQGTSEQFATAFAVIARHSGLPTRVVVGFRPGDEQADGTRVVRGEHALAWPEVYFEGLGWVPFSPTPDEDQFLEERPEPQPEQPQPVPDPEATETPAPDPDPAAEARGDDEDGTGGVLDEGWTPYAAAGGLVVLVLVGLLVARALRSWRHRRRGPRGAWAEVLDGLVLSGRRPSAADSSTRIAEHLAMTYGVPEALRLGSDADRAAFGPDAGAPAPRLGAAVRRVRRALRRQVPWWRRWWWPFDPRVLGRR
ncbi:DUF3488 and transglutaminase-like domain-containing protein [Nocardioides alkalitolerans]|uniref:DUF3488 and transglutaminase-like domain-containing protein n=1 Tax=Nocardioides alkalitolerans TaxID=281714 RepID=UPI000400B3ED|nr:transglutaminase domain-containing protein [Nocardioides alkalitolerans]